LDSLLKNIKLNFSKDIFHFRKEVLMEKGMNRREFLKTTVAAGAVLIAGDLLKGRTSVAQGSVQIPESEKITITTITDNYFDALRPDYKIAKRHKFKGGFIWADRFLHAEHGLACHIENVVNGHPHSFLFDYGIDFHGVSRNMDLLNINFERLEALGLSHSHYDHFGSLVAILKSKKGKIPQGITLYVGEEAFLDRVARLPNGTIFSVGHLKREDIESLGFVKIVEIKDPTPIVPGTYLTGKIEMVTEYEKGPDFLLKRGEKIERDDIKGEQSLIFNAKGKGLVVLSGCAHRGIVNTVKHAQKITGVAKVHAVIGGFHLTGAKPELIQRTIADIKAIGPDYIVPTHCTGFEGITAFAREMPDQFIFNMVGTRCIFTA
jgi:7,8-dihydropterin-6-yl-methyl-4-(beta-D-ribofuranosyl)aminobenzene 5'-phosphate synthase